MYIGPSIYMHPIGPPIHPPSICCTYVWMHLSSPWLNASNRVSMFVCPYSFKNLPFEFPGDALSTSDFRYNNNLQRIIGELRYQYQHISDWSEIIQLEQLSKNLSKYIRKQNKVRDDDVRMKTKKRMKGVTKRGPRCLKQCIQKRFISIIQCHYLC